VRVLTSVSESSADAQAVSGGAPASTSTGDSQKFWEFADLGFDTGKKLWFIQFYNGTNENVGTYFARSVNITRGRAAQYQWKDAKGAPFWHVRERFYATEVEKLAMDPMGGAMTLVFKGEEAPLEEEKVPSEFAYLLYAYHLTSKEKGRAPMGFVDFYGSDGSLVGRVENRWIIIEGVDRKTFGEYPGVRIRIDRNDIGVVTMTRTAIIIEGKPVKSH
jgi:hypothetical protein